MAIPIDPVAQEQCYVTVLDNANNFI